VRQVIETRPFRQHLNYIGSKYKLAPWIVSQIKTAVKQPLDALTAVDLFAGTGAVARSLRPLVGHVTANDVEHYSYVLNRHYIGNGNLPDTTTLSDPLSVLRPTKGLIFWNYCLGGGTGRRYFSDDNGQKLDAVRSQIELWKTTGVISDDVYYFLLTTLLESMDRIANTASVYAAFLKKLKKSAANPFVWMPAAIESEAPPGTVYQEDANLLIHRLQGDILYLDPPYNSRQYGSYYHLFNAITEYRQADLYGKTGMRPYFRSDYCRSRHAKGALNELIAAAKFRYIFLSYSNEGLMSLNDIADLLSAFGTYHVVRKRHARFRADQAQSRRHKASATWEYLHILEKQ
jgi:adenine-specific DNA-methyltransferase